MFQTSPKKLFKNIFLALVIFSSISFSQTTRSSFKILGIAVEGNKSADASTIIANSGLKVNDEIQIPGDQTLNAIKQLWSLNIFSDIQIAIDKQIQDGVFLKIIVKEQPRFEKLVIEGNDELSTTDIENKAGFIRGQIIKSADISRLRQRILKNYATDGYLNAQVDPLIYRFFTADTTKKGTSFATGATVTFGATAATNVVVVSSTSITATSPAGSAGAVTVTVTVSGHSGSLANG